MNKYIIRYGALVLDLNGNKNSEYGLIIAETLSDAITQIEDWYRDDLLEITLLRYVTQGTVIHSEDKNLIEELEDELC